MQQQQLITNYETDTAAATQAGSSIRIEECGGYVGRLVRAEAVTSSRGTQGLELAFKSANGQTADYLTLWTQNADGELLFGRKVLMAILTCMGLRSIQAQRGRIKKWNPDTRAEELTDAVLFPSMMDRDIGLLLVPEEYAKTDNTGTAWKMVVVGAFEPKTRRMPVEIIERKPNGGELLESVIKNLRPRPLKPGRQALNGGSGGGSGGYGGFDRTPPASANRTHGEMRRDARATASTGTGFDAMEDDIPF